MPTAPSSVASESGHYYRPDGTPAYEVERKDGKGLKPTTIREARAMGLYPSTTGIIDLAAKPGLQAWMQKQVLLAALTLPRLDGENDDAYCERIMLDSKEQAKKARDGGTLIHGALERFYLGQSYDPAYQDHIFSVQLQLEFNCGRQEWKPEKSYAYASGYGCKIDLHSMEWLIDYKGIDNEKFDQLKLWPEHYMQLAANRRAAMLADARCAIVFVTRDPPVKAVLLEAEEAELQRGLAMFDALLDYWWAKNGTPTYRRAA